MTPDAPALVRLRASLRGRAGLETALTEAAPRMAAGDDAEAWAEAALGLLHANAGAATLLAYLSLTGAPSVVAQAGRHATALCRDAGALAARDALARWDLLGRPEWWAGLLRLARSAPDCVSLALDHAGAVLEAVGAEGFSDFVGVGLKATGHDRARRRRFFAMDDALARQAMTRAGGLAAEERRIKLFVTALWGRVPALRPLQVVSGRPPPRRASLSDGVVLLPPGFPGVPAASQPALYRAAAAHAAAHLMFGAGRQKVGSLKPLQLALIGLVEDARVEALMLRRFPGLFQLWSPFHVARPEGGTAPALLARLARALLDPAYDDPHGFVAKARALFAAADPADPALSRRIGGLLGNDLGQMRVQFNARTWVIEPAYRDDNLGLWDFDLPADAEPQMIEMMVEAARLRQEAGEDRSDPRGETDGAAKARPRPAAADDGVVLARYPEWDAAQGVERPDWTCVRALPPPPGDPRRIDAALDAAPELRRRIDRLVRAARAGRPQRLRRQAEGSDLDLDAVLDSVLAEAAGELPDGRIHRATSLLVRDLATVVLIDVSESTRHGGVLEIERLAVAALGEALDRLGDTAAMLAFASDGREQVRLTRIKDFSEMFGSAARGRLAGLSAGLSTRLGAALRHAGAELARQRRFRRLALVLTDAEPSDIDVPDPADLVEDARRAVLRLRAQGTDTFAVVIGADGLANAARIFGRSGFVALRRIEDLPARLADLYFRLARR